MKKILLSLALIAAPVGVGFALVTPASAHNVSCFHGVHTNGHLNNYKIVYVGATHPRVTPHEHFIRRYERSGAGYRSTPTYGTWVECPKHR